MGAGWSDDQEASQSKISENPTETQKRTRHRPEPNGKSKPGDHEKLTLSSVHELKHILGDSDLPHSFQHLLTSLQNGLILNQNRQKYWIDKNGKNCFIVYARELSITWSESDCYWTWRKLNDATDETSVAVAELMNVCWLEVCGKFDTRKLSPETLYEVSFIVMMKQHSYGWDVPVNVTLDLPNVINNVHKVNMAMQPKGQWSEIAAGTFMTPPDTRVGELRFSLYEYDGGEWKRGLVIKGVKIQPKII